MTRAALARLGLILGGLGVGLGVGEGVMRALHPTLPSLEALETVDSREVGEFMRWNDPAAREAGCRPEGSAGKLHYRQRNATYAPPGLGPDPHALKLWVTGDSLVAGWGVGPERAWPHGLAQRVATDQGRRVMLTTVGGGGLGYCEILLDLNRLLDRAKPDVVVVQVFADDLEQRALLALSGGVAARPDAVPGLFAWTARRSWLANRLWFAWVSRLGGAEPLRAANAEGRAQFLAAMRLLDERLSAAGTKLLLALVPPAGVERCTAAGAWSDCDWLSHDLDWMAEALADAGHRTVDLRGIWATHDPETLPDEEAAWKERGRLPVHPGEGGHTAIAQAVLPSLVALIGEAPTKTGAAAPP